LEESGLDLIEKILQNYSGMYED